MFSIRFRGRSVALVPARDIETWSRDHAQASLRDVASHWAGRDALLRLSDTLLGPDEDVERAIAFLADRCDSGGLLALRLDEDGAASVDPSSLEPIEWDDMPMLSDLRPPSDEARGGDAPLPSIRDPLAPPRPSPLQPTASNDDDEPPTSSPSPTPSVVVFDTRGLCFGSDRETFVPTQIDARPGGPNYHFLTGIDAMRHVVEYARAHVGQRACVVGHTDTVGASASNRALSQRRAQTVQLFLQGDRASWAALSVANQTVADWQAFLQWAHLVMGMNCDPGPVDDDLGQETQAAMHRFRATYNARHGGALAVQGPFVAADWEAAFVCYRKNLAEQLGESSASLEGVLAAMAFGEPATLACGEAFPVEHVSLDGRASARNRRVDVVFYDPLHPPDFAAEPSGTGIYTDAHCTRAYESIAPSRFAMVRLCVQDALGRPLSGSTCRLLLDGEVTEATAGPDGYVEFCVSAEARTATLLVQDAEGRGQERRIMLGGLRAVDEDNGVEGRLRNLGFDTGPDIGKQPDALAGALSGFQRRCSLDPSGIADDATRARLVREHGC